MKPVLAIFIVIIFIAGCTNGGNTSVKAEKKDSSFVKDSTSPTETNTVTPPASNGQY